MEHDCSREEELVLTEVRRLARRQAGLSMASDAADDVAQDVAFAVLAALRKGRPIPRGALLIGLIRRMVRCRAADRLRREQRRGRRDSDYARERVDRRPAWMCPAAALDETEVQRFRERTLYELKEPCRRAFVMVREEHATYASAAEALSVSRTTIRSYVVAAERNFRRRLGEMGLAERDAAGYFRSAE